MEIETSLYAAAAELAKKRYPKGWGGAAAIQTETGNIYTSVAPDVENDSLNLCIEVGAFLQGKRQ